MAITIKEGTFALTNTAGKYELERTFDFTGGVKVAFTVVVNDAQSMTLKDIHRFTIEKVIESLQSTLPPSPNQPSSKD